MGISAFQCLKGDYQSQGGKQVKPSYFKASEERHHGTAQKDYDYEYRWEKESLIKPNYVFYENKYVPAYGFQY